MGQGRSLFNNLLLLLVAAALLGAWQYLRTQGDGRSISKNDLDSLPVPPAPVPCSEPGEIIDLPTRDANRKLVDQVVACERRLGAALEQHDKLAEAQRKTASGEDADHEETNGNLPAQKEDSSYFDHPLTKDEWTTLAKRGEIRWRLPCMARPSDGVDPSKREFYSPDERTAIERAYKRSYDRVWARIRPICVSTLGISEATAGQLGPDVCLRTTMAVLSKSEDASEAITRVAEVRAGIREPSELRGSLAATLLDALTEANNDYEQDLARELGPENARSIAYSDVTCVQPGGWTGGALRQ